MKKFGFIGLLLFFVLSFFVSFGIFRSYDLGSTIKIQEIIPSSLTTSFSLFSLIGTVEIAGLVLLTVLIFSRKLSKISALILFVISGVVEVIGKTIISQKGPPIEFLKTNLSLDFPSNYIPKEFFSYPSGHSTRTAFISGVILFLIWKSDLGKTQKYLISICVLFFDFLMFLSRVYLGEHWLTDVLGGMILGFSLSFLVPFLNNQIKRWGINF